MGDSCFRQPTKQLNNQKIFPEVKTLRNFDVRRKSCFGSVTRVGQEAYVVEAVQIIPENCPGWMQDDGPATSVFFQG